MVKIFGKEVDVTYFINESRGLDGKLKCKPSIVSKKSKPIERYIKSEQESDIPANASIIVIDGKKCGILRWEYDADNALAVLITDYVEENERNKDECEGRLEPLLKEWNIQVIAASPQMSAWCKLHEKEPENVDVDELEKLLGSQPISVLLDSTYINDGCVSVKSGGHIDFCEHTHSLGGHTNSISGGYATLTV